MRNVSCTMKSERGIMNIDSDHLTEPGVPIALNDNYEYIISYAYPGPLSCLSGIQLGCSDIVDAGTSLGVGRFCGYAVVCAGTTITIFYNRFEPAA